MERRRFLQSHTPLQLRAILEEMVRKDLLGPAGGAEEVITERMVRGQYVLGQLAPLGQRVEADELDDVAVGGDEDDMVRVVKKAAEQ